MFQTFKNAGKPIKKCFPLQFPHFRNLNKSKNIKIQSNSSWMLTCAHDNLFNKWILLQKSEVLQLPCLFAATQNSIFGLIQSERRNSYRDLHNQKCFLLSTREVEFVMKAARSSLTPSRKLTISQISSLATSATDSCKL